MSPILVNFPVLQKIPAAHRFVFAVSAKQYTVYKQFLTYANVLFLHFADKSPFLIFLKELPLEFSCFILFNKGDYERKVELHRMVLIQSG